MLIVHHNPQVNKIPAKDCLLFLCIAKEERFVSYAIVKRPMVSKPKRSMVMFYVQDKEGKSR